MGAVLLIEEQYQVKRMESGTETITTVLAKRDEQAFEQLFKTYFKRLHAYAYTILRDEAEAEEMVQQVFFKLWERNDTQSLSGSISAYLYRAVHNESLNYIKHQKVRSNYQMHVAYTKKNDIENPDKKLTTGELEKRIQTALNELPEQCRTIFQMSRFDDLKYREIADKLNISVKTVENQMGKALKLMRIKLVDFLTLIILLIQL